MRYVALYNHQLPQSALKSKTPLQAIKDWYAIKPELFHKRPYDHPGATPRCPCVLGRITGLGAYHLNLVGHHNRGRALASTRRTKEKSWTRPFFWRMEQLR